MPKIQKERERDSDAELARCGICEYRVKGREGKAFCIYSLIGGGEKGREIDDDDWCEDFTIFD